MTPFSTVHCSLPTFTHPDRSVPLNSDTQSSPGAFGMAAGPDCATPTATTAQTSTNVFTSSFIMGGSLLRQCPPEGGAPELARAGSPISGVSRGRLPRFGVTMSDRSMLHSPDLDESGLVADTLAREVARRRTFAIISHPDAGKTTLTEKLLLYA